MFDSNFDVNSWDTTFTLWELLLSIGEALFLGLLISFVYIKTHKTKTPSQSFSITLVILPMIMAMVIMLIGNSVARAFGLVGAFQIIRFRSEAGDFKDISYILFCMSVGLCCGLGLFYSGLIIAFILCATMVILEIVKFGNVKTAHKILKITIPESLNYQNAFDDIFQKYTSAYTLKKVKTVNMGSLFELHYIIVTKLDTNEKAFLDDLRCRNGNLNIMLILDVAGE